MNNIRFNFDITKILLIALTYQIMLNATRPLVSLYASDMGASTAEVGILTATYAFFPLLFAVQAGKISDRIGDRLPVVLGTIGLAVGTGIPYCFNGIWALYFSQAMIGLGQIFVNVSLQNLIGTLTPKELLDHRYSQFSLSVSLGSLIGPLIGGYAADFYGFGNAFLVATLIGILPVAFAFMLPVVKRTNGNNGTAGNHSFDLLKIAELRKALAISGLVLYSRDIFVAYFPIYAAEAGYSTTEISWVISIFGLASVLVRTFLARITGKWGRNTVLLLSLLSAGMAFVFIPLVQGMYLYGLFVALMGLGLGCGQPLTMTTTYNASPEARKGEALGLRLASNRLFQVIAPVFYGLLGSIVGLSAVFYVSGGFLILGSSLVRSGKNRKEKLTDSS